HLAPVRCLVSGGARVGFVVGSGQRVTLPPCARGLCSCSSPGSLMEYSLLCHASHAASLPPVRHKLLVLCIMLSLWAYTLYCCIGYCSSVPSLAADPGDPSSLHARPTELLNGYGGGELESSSRVDEWEEGRTLNGSETKKLPQAIIIGVKKGGTRALLEFLRLHPDIRAVGAEPHFFDRNYEKGLEWYSHSLTVSLEHPERASHSHSASLQAPVPVFERAN
ncbi:hypothetical protein NFI96_016467, partial [Prochilodus magdalenae]